MRYILDSSGYIESVSCNTFECNDKSCTEYTGTIPEGYSSLEAWATTANIRAYKIVNGNLSFDKTRDEALQAEWNGSEQIIGTWIDGKPIYRKTFEIGTPSAKSVYYQHNISNLGTVIKAYGSFLRSSTNIQNLIPGNYTNWESWLYDFGAATFTLKFSDNQWNNGVSNCFIVLEYTKTTD